MIGGLLRWVWAGLAVGLVAGCTEMSTATTGGPDLRAAAPTQAAPALAFEPVTGIPEDRTGLLAEALVTDAVERGLVVVPRDADDAVYFVQGYFSAASVGSNTVVTYAWDVFDRQESRVHRIAGTERLQAALPDPWQAVTDDALRRIAQRTSEGLEAWLSGAAPAAAQTSQAPAQDGVSGMTAMLPETGIAAQPAAATAGPSGGPRVFVGDVNGIPPREGEVLARAMAGQLAAVGAAPAAGPGAADYVVTAEATVGPESQSRRKVAIIWSVSRPGGDGLGTIRQVRRMSAAALESGWPTSANQAAGAAVSGLINLMRN